MPRYNNKAAAAAAAAANVAATAVGRAAWRAKRRMRIPFHVTHCVFDRRSFQMYQEVRECARYFGCLEKMQQHCCIVYAGNRKTLFNAFMPLFLLLQNMCSFKFKTQHVLWKCQ